jgi:hypothetical protein
MNRFAVSDDFKKILEDSLFVHRPLPLRPELSLEAAGRRKPVLKRRTLWDMNSAEKWRQEGDGELAHDGIPDKAGRKSLRMEVPARAEKWPAENPEGDYIPFCRQRALFETGGQNWEEFNRVSFAVYPDCAGARAVTLAFIYANDGAEKIPDAFGREGRHELNLVNRQWNHCSLEIPELPRDAIVTAGFECAAYGRDRSTGETLRFYIGELTLETVEAPEPARGWAPAPGRIIYSMTGYAAEGEKTAILGAGASPPAARRFRLRTLGGETVFQGELRRRETRLGTFDLIDFSAFREAGEYTLSVEGVAETGPFRVGGDIWGPSVWKALNFIFCERCGYPVPEKHGCCHGDILAEHEGKKIVYNGGWHDAGDLSQQTLQTAEVTLSLLEIAARAKNEDPILYLRLLEEAEWGLEFILKCRFGDGFRASSAGLVDWTDGIIGTMDDRPARVQDNSFDNYIYAGVEAFAAGVLERDPLFCEGLRRFAEEDFAFAREAFRQRGFSERPEFWEHSYPASPSLHRAACSWSASALYRLTGKAEYAACAAEALDYVLECQRLEGIGEGSAELGGFFYRGRDRKLIQHFNHQSRDNLYLQALDLALETQPDHAAAGRWREAVSSYAAYLKAVSAFTDPYGLLPGGVYHVDEAKDRDSFERQHLFSGGAGEAEYRAQLRAGIRLDEAHYLRIFPVWFSFRGNSAVHLSTGRNAAICGRILGDRELLDLAREQLYWVVGKNPFAQSLMYGEGCRYPEQAAFLPGTMTGQLPVGIQTRGDEDVPYWPQANNATYKEVWLTSAGKWLSLIAEIV